MRNSALLTSGFILFFSIQFCFGQNKYRINERAKFVIDSTYQALLKKNKVVGASIALVENGEIVYAAGYGFADLATKTPATEETIYRIGSCTKSFTALSLLQLQEHDKIDITQSVKTYLPELTIISRFNDGNEIFINDMLTHVSGLPCDIANGFYCDSPPDIKWVIQELNKQTTISPRKYKQAYSNIAYGLLGEVIARKGNATYAQYVQESIFNKLDMQSSFIEYDEKWKTQYSKGYSDNKEIKDPLIRDQAAGLIHSNVLDMCRYMMMYLNNGNYRGNQIVSADAIAEMEKNQLTGIELGDGERWGYGLYAADIIVKKGNDSSLMVMIGHGGDTYIYHADFKYIPELNIGAVVLTNSNTGARMSSANRLLKIYLKETKGETMTVRSSSTKRDTLNKNQDVICSGKTMLGKYNVGDFVIDAQNEKQMSFKQGPVKIIFTQQQKDSTRYSAKAVMLHIIPIKIKDQEFRFVTKKDKTYLKVIFTKDKNEEYMAVKSASSDVSSVWKNKFGEYKAVGKIYPCAQCTFMNMEGLSMTLSEKDGFVYMNSKGKTPDTKTSLYLEIVSDTLAVGGGIGRGTGETVKVLDNGNVYYSGFEFEKVK